MRNATLAVAALFALTLAACCGDCIKDPPCCPKPKKAPAAAPAPVPPPPPAVIVPAPAPK
jgi:hypothetical protein